MMLSFYMHTLNKSFSFHLLCQDRTLKDLLSQKTAASIRVSAAWTTHARSSVLQDARLQVMDPRIRDEDKGGHGHEDKGDDDDDHDDDHDDGRYTVSSS